MRVRHRRKELITGQNKKSNRKREREEHGSSKPRPRQMRRVGELPALSVKVRE